MSRTSVPSTSRWRCTAMAEKRWGMSQPFGVVASQGHTGIMLDQIIQSRVQLKECAAGPPCPPPPPPPPAGAPPGRARARLRQRTAGPAPARRRTRGKAQLLPGERRFDVHPQLAQARDHAGVQRLAARDNSTNGPAPGLRTGIPPPSPPPLRRGAGWPRARSSAPESGGSGSEEGR